MKTKIIIPTILFIATCTLARVIAPFPGWGQLKESSPDIFVVSCSNPAPSSAGAMVVGATESDSEVMVLAVLKGTNNISRARLQTDHDLQQGQGYLVFGHFENGVCQAWEEYKVIPLGRNIPFNSLKDKPLDEQLKILFRTSVNYMNLTIQKYEEEKQRLEELPAN